MASSSADDRLIGQVVADRYRIMELLGEGGMGRVYLAEHVRIGRRSAVKVISPDMSRSPDAIMRFNREAANAARINHPNVAQIYDFGETSDGLLYLAMEFIEGETLRAIIQRRGPMAPARAAALMNQIADALEAAHHLGLVHRDLKPDNIMVAHHHDGSDWVKVVDFGIAKTVQGGDGEGGSQTLTTVGVALGTPEYMSPEQLAGERLDNRTDLYSLGLVLFNMLTGKLPFPELTSRERLVDRLTSTPQRLVEVAPAIAWPRALQATLDRALAPKAAGRYASVTEFALDVTLAAASFDPYATRPVPDATARVVAPPKPVPRKRRRWLAPLIVIAAGVVVLAAAPYRERIVPYTQQKFPYVTKLAASGMTGARLVADAALDFYRFYHKPPAHVAAPPIVDTAAVDTASVPTGSSATPGVVTPSAMTSAVFLLQGTTTPEPTRDSEPPKNTTLAHVAARPSTPDSAALVKSQAKAATALDSAPVPPVGAPTKQSAAHAWLRANGDSGAAQPVSAKATDAERIRRLGDELRGHAIRANQFMARGDVPQMRSELRDLTGEAQVFRVLYPEAADTIQLDQLLRVARARLYETCRTAAADSTVSLPPNFACQQLVPGNPGRHGEGEGARPPF